MKYISTRGGVDPVGFREAVMMGLARDGGLLLPESIPDVRDRLSQWRGLLYQDLCFEIMRLFTDLGEEDLRRMIGDSYAGFAHAEVTPVAPLRDLFLLELFHGPTLAFKDVALQFLGRLFEHILAESGGELNILGATSGDTGSAAIHGVKGRRHIRIFMTHPHGRISPTQERQMTSVLDDNVFNLAVDGTFDDCQALMKAIFNDLEFRDRYALGAVNSINWARVLAQIVYYFYGAFRVLDATGANDVSFSVPTGNFGDIFAGYMAARMGLPVRRLVLATNENDILSKFFNTGEYRRGEVRTTISPSMDIQVASNFERYLYHRLGADPRRVVECMREFAKTGRIVLGAPGGAEEADDLFRAGAGTTEETLEAIRDAYAADGVLLDPHTAVGVHVARRYVEDGTPTICLATAHPAKFGETIQQAIGHDVAHHPLLDALRDCRTRVEVLPASADALREYVACRAGTS